MTYAINATGTQHGKTPEPNHFYPTPPEPIESLISYYQDIIDGHKFHDASCGDGRISEILRGHGFVCHATDLIDRGYGTAPVDFLSIPADKYAVGEFSTIQNPPFKLWTEFVFKCHELRMPFIAMFAKQQVFNAAKRLPLWRKHPPKAVHPITWRVDFSGQGRPPMDCCWIVWGDNVPVSNEPLERG